jgi:uracil-DNA glycosylase
MRRQSAELDRLLANIRSCRVCAEAPLRTPLPHEPRPVLRASRTARLAVCGQAPGTRVHASGVPFTDTSGERLRAWMGVTPQEFYDETRLAIIPMGFCFPGQDAKGGDLPPRAECAKLWHGTLFEALPQLELVLAVGSYAQRWRRRRHPRLLPLPHPSWRNNAWLKCNPWFEEELLPVLRREVRALL